jgi:hypothetical protein
LEPIRPPYLLHKVDHFADGGDVVVVDGPVGDAAVEMGVVIGSFAAQVVNLESRQNVKICFCNFCNYKLKVDVLDTYIVFEKLGSSKAGIVQIYLLLIQIHRYKKTYDQTMVDILPEFIITNINFA